MPKLKTKKAAAKRFKITGTGKLKRNKSNTQHILGKKSRKEKKKSETCYNRRQNSRKQG